MKRSLLAVAGVLAGLVPAPVALAGDDMTSLSYISYLERYATIRPAHGDSTYDVVVNMPVLAGDRLDTSRGARVEVQLADGSTLWLDEFATVDFDAVALSSDDTARRTALFLAEGTAAVEVPATAAGDGSLRFDSPAGAVFLNRPGLYRLELRGSRIRVQAYSGFAELPAGVGSEILRGGEEALLGTDSEIERASIGDTDDDFWNWVQERRHVPAGRTAEHVDVRSAGRAAVLDSYGDWVYVPSYSSYMWQPRVSVGWVPYSYGRWYWTPVGWSWISYEPWGWFPFHYGSWTFDASFGWLWGWDSVWGPAWVNWFYTPGYVGWCPRGYYDSWYGRHGGHGGHGWGGDGPHPHHWAGATFAFSGRARLDQIDPRPWTVVPSGNFASHHIDRIRLDADRFLHEGQAGREGIVRSGPMVTSLPARANVDRSIETFFRTGPTREALPDLSSVMRREVLTGVRAAQPLPELKLLHTGEIAASLRAGVQPASADAARASTVRRWSGADAGADRFTTVNPGELRGPVVLHRTDSDSTGQNPPVVRREVVRRDIVRRDDVNSVKVLGPPQKVDGAVTHGGTGSTVERHVAPAPVRPPSGSVSWNGSAPSVGNGQEVARFQDAWVVRRDLARAGAGAAVSGGGSLHVSATDTLRSVRSVAVAERSVAVRSSSATSKTGGSSSHSSSHAGSSSHSSGGSSAHGHRR